MIYIVFTCPSRPQMIEFLAICQTYPLLLFPFCLSYLPFRPLNSPNLLWPSSPHDGVFPLPIKFVPLSYPHLPCSVNPCLFLPSQSFHVSPSLGSCLTCLPSSPWKGQVLFYIQRFFLYLEHSSSQFLSRLFYSFFWYQFNYYFFKKAFPPQHNSFISF